MSELVWDEILKLIPIAEYDDFKRLIGIVRIGAFEELKVEYDTLMQLYEEVCGKKWQSPIRGQGGLSENFKKILIKRIEHLNSLVKEGAPLKSESEFDKQVQDALEKSRISSASTNSSVRDKLEYQVWSLSVLNSDSALGNESESILKELQDAVDADLKYLTASIDQLLDGIQSVSNSVSDQPITITALQHIEANLETQLKLTETEKLLESLPNLEPKRAALGAHIYAPGNDPFGDIEILAKAAPLAPCPPQISRSTDRNLTFYDSKLSNKPFIRRRHQNMTLDKS